MSYRCGKSIYGQGLLWAKLGITIDAQVEAPGHGKWWLDGMTGSDKRYCQQCMCAINTPGEETNNNKPMSSAKWIDEGGDFVAVSPAEECVRMLNDPFRVNGMKSEGMRVKREGKALVERNDYITYTMADVPIIPDWKISFRKGKYNGIRAYYNIRTDPDLGVGLAALRRVACGCGPCKEQLDKPWIPGVDMRGQSRYAQNKDCSLWPSYEGANDWGIFQLAPRTEDDRKGARESNLCVLDAIEMRIYMKMKMDDVGAIGTTDDTAMGCYLVKWLSEPYTLQADTEGMAGMISAGAMVVDGVYFNRVERAPYWYTPSTVKAVFEMRHVLWTGLQLLDISRDNVLPNACNRMEATRRKAVKMAAYEHNKIMEEAERRDRLEYDPDDEDKIDDEVGSEVESDEEW